MNNNYNFRYIPGAFPNNMYMRPPFIKPAPFLKGSKITFTSILNGTSKTLEVINQAIPVIYQVKPILSNAKTMLKIAKGINSKDVQVKKQEPKTIKQSNFPTFYI